MRFEDERYVRLYTRDSATWVMAPWEAKCVLPLILRKLDRAGLLDLGKRGLAGLAAVIGLPPDITERGLAYWVDDGTFAFTDGTLVMPNFLVAQETKKSDTERKREQRERDRFAKFRDASREVTPCHTESRDVTDVTPRRDLVTDGHSVPSHAEPNRTIPPTPAGSQDPMSGIRLKAVPFVEPDEPATLPPIDYGSDSMTFAASEEYSQAMSSVLGGFAMGQFQKDSFKSALRGFLPPGLSGEDVRARVRYSATKYAKFAKENDQYEGGKQPKNWLVWLNKTGNGASLSKGVPPPEKPYVARPLPGCEPPENYQATPEELAKLMGTVSRMFSGDMSDPDEETAKERAS